MKRVNIIMGHLDLVEFILMTSREDPKKSPGFQICVNVSEQFDKSLI